MAVSHARIPNLPLQAGAVFFLLCGLLQVSVGYAGLDAYLGGLGSQWSMLTGGFRVPPGSVVRPADWLTTVAQAHVVLAYCLGVAGLGVLGLVVAWALRKRASWMAYAMGAVVIGIHQIGLVFALVTPGVIEETAVTLAGPVLWLLAVLVTPFGLVDERRVSADARVAVAGGRG